MSRWVQQLGLLFLLGAELGAAEPPSKKETVRVVQLRVTDAGFEPSPLHVKAGQRLKLVVTRTTDDTCATEMLVPDYAIRVALPLNKPVEIVFTPHKAGQITYGCAMGMMVAGVLVVE